MVRGTLIPKLYAVLIRISLFLVFSFFFDARESSERAPAATKNMTLFFLSPKILFARARKTLPCLRTANSFQFVSSPYPGSSFLCFFLVSFFLFYIYIHYVYSAYCRYIFLYYSRHTFLYFLTI